MSERVDLGEANGRIQERSLLRSNVEIVTLVDDTSKEGVPAEKTLRKGKR